MCETDLIEEDGKHSVLTYVDQVIANPVNFPVFENEVADKLNIAEIHRCLVRCSLVCQSNTKIDIICNRVRIYLFLTDMVSAIRHTIAPLLT